MSSPFPGMDPYFDAYGDWLDFHARFTTYCCDFFNERLPEGYAASLDTRLKLVHADDNVVRELTAGTNSDRNGVIETGGRTLR